MKLSIHETIRGKPVAVEDLDGRKYYESHGHRVNLGYGWVNIEADWPDVFELITVDGCATSAWLNSNNRREDTFVSRELIMVDIDSGMTIPELLTDDFYNQYAAGFYTTPSHRDDAHRFRIMFRLAEPITNSSQLQKLNRMLLQVFTQADAACKDATRIFYGTENCVIKERTNNLLPAEIVEAMIQAYNKQEAQRLETYTQAEHRELNDQDRQRILNLLHSSYVGNYPVWRNIGWGLRRGGFSLADFQYVTTGMMNKKSARDAEAVWQDARDVQNGVTMGSVIHFLKERHGTDCLMASKKDLLDTADSKIKELKERIKQWQQKQ
jgi:hypothetical protein